MKSMKSILKKTLPPNLLNYEEFSTILTDVEAVLNSHPLLPLDITPSDGSIILIPGHFLIGRPLKSLPIHIDKDTNPSLLKRWKLVRYLSHHIWKMWKTTYLQTLQSREKWKNSTPNFQVGDVVILKDETLTSHETLLKRSWPLALIVHTHAGHDGLVGVVDVRCKDKIYTRPVNRLVKLVSVEEDTVPQHLPPEDVQAS